MPSKPPLFLSDADFDAVPGLSKDELADMAYWISECLCHRGQVPPTVPGYRHFEHPWQWIAKELGRSEQNPWVLRHMFFDAPRPRRPKWYDVYRRFSRLRECPLLSDAGYDGLFEAADEGRVGVVVYLRALERFPGGNADMRVHKYVLSPEPERSLRAWWFADFDGSLNSCYPLGSWLGGWPIQLRSTRFESQLLPRFLDFIENCSGVPKREFSIVDPQIDDDAYELEWSSVECMFYAPWSFVGEGSLGDDEVEPFPWHPEFEAGSWLLVAHLHRQSIGTKLEGSLQEGSVEARALIDAVFDATGLPRPADFGQKPCPITEAIGGIGNYWSVSTELELGDWNSFYQMPMYLRLPPL